MFHEGTTPATMMSTGTIDWGTGTSTSLTIRTNIHLGDTRKGERSTEAVVRLNVGDLAGKAWPAEWLLHIVRQKLMEEYSLDDKQKEIIRTSGYFAPLRKIEEIKDKDIIWSPDVLRRLWVWFHNPVLESDSVSDSDSDSFGGRRRSRSKKVGAGRRRTSAVKSRTRSQSQSQSQSRSRSRSRSRMGRRRF